MSASDIENASYDEAWQRIAELADDLSNHHDFKVAERVTELLDWLDAVHREGLGRLVEMIRDWRGEIFLESVARDPIAGTLLDLYGLGEGEEERAEEDRKAVDSALEEIRPYVESHGGTIAVENIADGVVKVRMLGSCDGCPSSAATLTQGVETALREHWPNFRRLEVIDDTTNGEGAAAAAAAAPAQPQQLLQIRGHEGR